MSRIKKSRNISRKNSQRRSRRNTYRRSKKVKRSKRNTYRRSRKVKRSKRNTYRRSRKVKRSERNTYRRSRKVKRSKRNTYRRSRSNALKNLRGGANPLNLDEIKVDMPVQLISDSSKHGIVSYILRKSEKVIVIMDDGLGRQAVAIKDLIARQPALKPAVTQPLQTLAATGADNSGDELIGTWLEKQSISRDIESILKDNGIDTLNHLLEIFKEEGDFEFLFPDDVIPANFVDTGKQLWDAIEKENQKSAAVKQQAGPLPTQVKVSPVAQQLGTIEKENQKSAAVKQQAGPLPTQVKVSPVAQQLGTIGLFRPGLYGAPKGAAVTENATARAEVSSAKEPPPGWELRESTNNPGRSFFLHLVTGKTQWTPPTAQDIADADIAAAALPAAQQAAAARDITEPRTDTIILSDDQAARLQPSRAVQGDDPDVSIVELLRLRKQRKHEVEAQPAAATQASSMTTTLSPEPEPHPQTIADFLESKFPTLQRKLKDYLIEIKGGGEKDYLSEYNEGTLCDSLPGVQNGIALQVLQNAEEIDILKRRIVSGDGERSATARQSSAALGGMMGVLSRPIAAARARARGLGPGGGQEEQRQPSENQELSEEEPKQQKLLKDMEENYYHHLGWYKVISDKGIQQRQGPSQQIADFKKHETVPTLEVNELFRISELSTQVPWKTKEGREPIYVVRGKTNHGGWVTLNIKKVEPYEVRTTGRRRGRNERQGQSVSRPSASDEETRQGASQAPASYGVSGTMSNRSVEEYILDGSVSGAL